MPNPNVEKLRASLRGRIAIAIDAANLHKSVADMATGDETTRYAVDYKKFKDFFASLGNLQQTSLYTAAFEGDGHHKFLYFLNKGLGFDLHTKPIKEYADHTPEHPHRKANFDVEIAVDGTFNMDDFDTFILFSGDCDFDYLVRFMRGHGKTVIVISHRDHVARELIAAASHYFDVSHLKDELLKNEPRPPRDAKNPAR